MLMSECRIRIKVEIKARRAARIEVGMPPDLSEPEGQEEEPEELVPMKLADPKEDGMELSEDELASVMGFDMEDAMTEFAVAQAAVKMLDQQAILESIQDEVYVKPTRRNGP
ncbi:hypothetical protein D1007_19990 [Hordeum vulgare]|nr:hypothetical protein D1007_19990 [Hordeum vulgare]